MPTPHLLFELLENSGLVKGNTISVEKINSLSLADLVDIAAQSIIITSAESLPRNKKAFTHSASLSLGGGSYPCQATPCRKRHVRSLSQFAALYSDQVYIHNFLDIYANHPERLIEQFIEIYRRNLAHDIEVLLELRTLIEAGRVIPITTPEAWCVMCFGRKVAMEHFDRNVFHGLTLAGEYLRERFLRDCRYSISRQGKNYSIEVISPDDLLDHGFRATDLDISRVANIFPEVSGLALHQKNVKLSAKQVEKLEFHKFDAARILENVLFEFTASQTFGTSLLTERPLHVKIIQRLTGDSKQERRNALIRRHLTTLVPYLDNLPPKELIKIREEEEDSFILFRQALNKAIDSVNANVDEFDERFAKEIYGDVLEPGVSRLELKLNKAKGSLAKSSFRKSVAWVGSISFGLLTGIVPSGLAAAATALGLTKIAADLGESALQARGDENLVRDEDMYFLWKVRRARK